MELDVSKGFLKPDEAFPFEAEVVLPPQEVNGETVSFDPVALQGTYTVYAVRSCWRANWKRPLTPGARCVCSPPTSPFM